ncbi:MAG TPA: hypothetical protein VK771_11135 [Acidimicrobiia bacterium]|nr:hypothetical protein [Acidimicrobiia bacterium]
MDRTSSPTPAELTIMIAGAVMLIGSFFDFAGSVNAWGTYLFPVATLLPLYGTVMALEIGLTKFANVSLPQRVVGFTWEQVHLVLGIMAGCMAVGWLVTDLSSRGFGYWLEVLGGIAVAAGAVVLQRERNTGAIG